MRKAVGIALIASMMCGSASCEPSSDNNIEQVVQESAGVSLSDPEMVPLYKEWVQKATTTSAANNIPAFIVYKREHEMDFLQGGIVTKTFPTELGFNPVDAKTREYDGCTPEGFYEIVAVKDTGQTHFYRAFLINYPNKRDKKIYNELKESGEIKEGVGIGGAVEIHGGGSGNGLKGNDWTLGCMALSNPQMDELFDIVEQNYKNGRPTFVAIVRNRLDISSD